VFSCKKPVKQIKQLIQYNYTVVFGFLLEQVTNMKTRLDRDSTVTETMILMYLQPQHVCD